MEILDITIIWREHKNVKKKTFLKIFTMIATGGIISCSAESYNSDYVARSRELRHDDVLFFYDGILFTLKTISLLIFWFKIET